MPAVATYVVINDSTQWLPWELQLGELSGGGTIPVAGLVHRFDAPNVNSEFPSLLVIRVDPADEYPAGGGVRVQATLNTDPLGPGPWIMDHRFDTEPTRSWHEVVRGDSLQGENNELHLQVRADEEYYGNRPPPYPKPWAVGLAGVLLFYKVSMP